MLCYSKRLRTPSAKHADLSTHPFSVFLPTHTPSFRDGGQANSTCEYVVGITSRVEAGTAKPGDSSLTFLFSTKVTRGPIWLSRLIAKLTDRCACISYRTFFFFFPFIAFGHQFLLSLMMPFGLTGGAHKRHPIQSYPVIPLSPEEVRSTVNAIVPDQEGSSPPILLPTPLQSGHDHSHDRTMCCHVWYRSCLG
jgi:hypothetical protein